MIRKERVLELRSGIDRAGPVVYWMSRDQRARDNLALAHAAALARWRRAPLATVFCLAPAFLGATLRQYDFMLRGLEQTSALLAEKNIAFFLLKGEPGKEIPQFIEKHDVSELVTDFDPLRIKRQWKRAVARNIEIPFHEVDAHNIAPCRHVSSKQEYGAYTIRPKINRLLPTFLEPLPPLKKHPHNWPDKIPKIQWNKLLDDMKIDRSIGIARGIEPGENAARKCLRTFINSRLEHYDTWRNDPNLDAASGLSPYLHFGHISAQRVALEVSSCDAPQGAKDAFIEELIVRRELSDNFCFFNADYDSVRGFPPWASATQDKHRGDPREYLYSMEQFEAAETHDPLWNAAQIQMARTGVMHGYMRMYWGKKILEWTASPGQAMEIAIALNDKYELDGRDPNGYTGIAWCIGGVHDRAWKERPVFGKIRYMNANGCRRKFDVDAYIRKYS